MIGVVGATQYAPFVPAGVTLQQTHYSAKITAISGNGTTVTVTAANNFFVGQSITIKNVTTTLGYNGTYTVASATPTGFTYTSSTTGVGGVTSIPSAQPNTVAPIPSNITWVFAVCVGGGPAGSGSSNFTPSGGAGISWGWTLAMSKCVVGTAGIPVTGSGSNAGGYTRYGHIIAGSGNSTSTVYFPAGGSGGTGAAGYNGELGGLAQTATRAATAGRAGGGGGLSNATASSATPAGNGGDGMSGGAGGTHSSSGTQTNTGGNGGSGYCGGGGGHAVNNSGACVGGNGGNGRSIINTSITYTGGTGSSGASSASGGAGGGGAGVAGNGGNASLAFAGVGGLGGGAGGNSPNTSSAGAGGSGILYLFY